MEGHWGGQGEVNRCVTVYLSQSCHSSDPGHVSSVTDHEQARLCVMSKDNTIAVESSWAAMHCLLLLPLAVPRCDLDSPSQSLSLA